MFPSSPHCFYRIKCKIAIPLLIFSPIQSSHLKELSSKNPLSNVFVSYYGNMQFYCNGLQLSESSLWLSASSLWVQIIDPLWLVEARSLRGRDSLVRTEAVGYMLAIHTFLPCCCGQRKITVLLVIVKLILHIDSCTKWKSRFISMLPLLNEDFQVSISLCNERWALMDIQVSSLALQGGITKVQPLIYLCVPGRKLLLCHSSSCWIGGKED